MRHGFKSGESYHAARANATRRALVLFICKKASDFIRLCCLRHLTPHFMLRSAIFLLSTCVLLPLSRPAQAQATSSSLPMNPASPTDTTYPFGLLDNMELVYTITDAAGKPAGSMRQRVVNLGSKTDKKTTQTTNTALLKSGLYDKNNRLLHLQDVTFACRRDTSFTDGRSEMDPKSLASFRDRLLAYAPVPLAWPHQPTVGSALPAGGVEVQVSSTAVDIAKVSALVRNRRVVSGPEAVVTPAGTFQCYKVEAEREASTAPRADMVLRNKTRVVDYYSPAVGIVKTELYTKKGKLAQTRVLQARNPGN